MQSSVLVTFLQSMMDTRCGEFPGFAAKEVIMFGLLIYKLLFITTNQSSKFCEFGTGVAMQRFMQCPRPGHDTIVMDY